MDENGGWEINGNLSTDNEPVDYLWVINDDRSWRGLASLNQEHFEQAGVHRVELIVFDDDGATHSTVLELEILAAEPEETADSLAWIDVVLLVGVLVGVLTVRRRSSGTQSLQSGRFRQQPREKNPVHHRIMMQRLKKTKREDESCSLKRWRVYLQPKPTSVEEHHARQERLAAQFRQDDLLVLASPPHAVHSNDVEYPYRTSSDLIYLTGWTEAESVFVMRYENNGWVSALFVHQKTRSRKFGRVVDPASKERRRITPCMRPTTTMRLRTVWASG